MTRPLALALAATSTALLVGCAELKDMKSRVLDPAAQDPATAASMPGAATDPYAPGQHTVRTPSYGSSNTTLAAQAAPRTDQQVVIDRKKIRVVSKVLDEHCANIVDPPDTADNAAVLLNIAMEALPALLDDKSAAKTGKQRRHLLSKELRQQAMYLNWLPMAVERRYGEMQHQQFVDEGIILARQDDRRKLYDAADALLAELVRQLPPNPYSFEIFVRKRNDDNAAALPGGLMYIDASLLRPEKRSLARFALAHELGHILKRHQTQIAQARILDTVSLAGNVDDLLKTMREPGKIAGTVIAATLSGKAVFGRHFRGQELQADACAVSILDQAQVPPRDIDQSITAFLKSLPVNDRIEKSKSNAGVAMDTPEGLVELVMAPMDSHPGFDQRRDNLQQMRVAIRQGNKPAPAPKSSPTAR
ncbi:M48 family metalloprotease [Rubrivivax gelatinosus]|uniref:M48 family metalloprotease n=1 Tax=Rubrivivax gelatinosus TaxID=28068 RepID=UPI0005C196EE|nr:M48 family metalloprotease [Rubrivivax gelatinosus]MBG6081557.1 Zn-dependent protease with chaperone function [Rubrivivax gelatinosus]